MAEEVFSGTYDENEELLALREMWAVEKWRSAWEMACMALARGIINVSAAS